MRVLVFARQKNLFTAIARKFKLSPTKPRIPEITEMAEGNGFCVILCERCSGILSSVLKTYQPERLYFTDFGLSTLEERHVGDIVLPNVFFELDTSLRETEITKDTIDVFAKNAIFLEAYEQQGDFDFSDFGFSIGGACVSTTDTNGMREDTDFLEKVGIAYGADALDSEAYSFVREALEALWKDPCVVLGLSGGYAENATDTNIGETVLAERISLIIAFLEESLSVSE